FSGYANYHGPSIVSMAGRSHFGLLAQTAGPYRPVGMVPEVFFANAGSICEHAAEAQDAFRLRLPSHPAGPMARRFREDRHSRGSSAAYPERERRPPAGPRQLSSPAEG